MFKTCSVHPVHLTFLTSQKVYRNLEVEHLNLGFTSCLAKKVNKTFVKDGVDHEFLQPSIGILKKNNFQVFVRVFNNFELKGAPFLAKKSTKRCTIFAPKKAPHLW